MKVVSFILFLFVSVTASSKTIVAGKGHAITTLKQAIAIAKDGDSIFLQPGIYKEGNIIITKSVFLSADGSVILDGESKYEILTISGKNITIKGIGFRNSGYSAMNDFASIKVIDATNIIVE